MKPKIELDYSKIADVEIDGTPTDHDFCDCFIISASYGDRDMTEEELDILNDDSDFVYSQVEKWIY